MWTTAKTLQKCLNSKRRMDCTTFSWIDMLWVTKNWINKNSSAKCFFVEDLIWRMVNDAPTQWEPAKCMCWWDQGGENGIQWEENWVQGWFRRDNTIFMFIYYRKTLDIVRWVPKNYYNFWTESARLSVVSHPTFSMHFHLIIVGDKSDFTWIISYFMRSTYVSYQLFSFLAIDDFCYCLH